MAKGGGDRFARMTTAPVERLVLELAGPSIVMMLITALYNMADTYFVGTVGTSATAAVGVVFSLMSFIQALGFFFGHGSGNYISRQLGAQNHADAARMASTGFFSALLLGIILAAAGLFMIEPLALLLGSTETILPHAADYMVYILLAAPAMMASLQLNNLLRFQGSNFDGMVGMTIGAILNIILDPILIWGFNMGTAGAGLATMASQYVSLFILLGLCWKGNNIRINPRQFKPSFGAYREMLRGGTPSLCRQGVAAISILIFNQVAGGFGDAAIAAMSIVTRVTQFASSALIGFGQGFQPVCGFNYGAKQYGRVIKAFWFCVKFSFFFLLALGAAGFIFSPQIIALFRNDAAVVEIGAFALRLQCLTFPFIGFYVMGSMMLQTMGMAGKASVLAMARQGMFLVPFILIAVPFIGLLGLQIAQPIADVFSILISLPLVFGTLKEMKLLGQAPNEPQA